MDDYYWELLLRDGTKIPIPPKYVDMVRRKMVAKDPIPTSRKVIPFAQIESFDKTSRRQTDTKLLEDVAQAFGEPMARTREFSDGTADEAVAIRWVKKQVTQREWGKYYSPHGYRRINESGGITVVAWKQPIHQFDATRMEYCTPDEVIMLTK